MSRLRKSAKGQQCLIRIPGVCNWNPETTVLAHLNGGGMGAKKSDLQGAFCCSSCHDEIDRRTRIFDADYVELCHRQGVERTQQYWLENGLISVK
ncbi:MAG: DUF1364 domain-containing protein [Methylobacter sp.]